MKDRQAKRRLNVRRKKDTRYPWLRIKDYEISPLNCEIGRVERFSFYTSPMPTSGSQS